MPEPLRSPRNGHGPADLAMLAGEPVVAVDLGATHLRVAVAGRRGIERIAVHRTADLRRTTRLGIVPGVVEAVLAAIAGQLETPRAIGVGVAAYVGHHGEVLQERPFGLLAGTELRDSLAVAAGVAVRVDNDANLAVLGEVEFGAARGLTDVVVLTLGTNIGAGIVAGGRLVRGAHGAAGEAGTILVPALRGRDGRSPRARAGRLGEGDTDAPDHYALFEHLAGGGALLRYVREAEPAAPSAGIFELAAAGDRRAQTAVRRGIEGWAMLIADLVALLDPEAFVLSGGLVEEAPSFIEPLRRRAAELSPLPPEIRVGELGAQAGLAGAVVAARSAKTAAPNGDRLEGGSRISFRAEPAAEHRGSQSSEGELGE